MTGCICCHGPTDHHGNCYICDAEEMKQPMTIPPNNDTPETAPNETPENHGLWQLGVPVIFFECTHGVFPAGKASLCYTTSKERAELIVTWLKEAAASRAECARHEHNWQVAEQELKDITAQYHAELVALRQQLAVVEKQRDEALAKFHDPFDAMGRIVRQRDTAQSEAATLRERVRELEAQRDDDAIDKAKNWLDLLTIAERERDCAIKELVTWSTEAGSAQAARDNALTSLFTAHQRIAELEETIRIEKAVSEGIKRADQAVSSCGHNEQYLWSPDGVGKVILCSVCKMNSALASLATVTAQAAAMREALDLFMKNVYKNDDGTWTQIAGMYRHEWQAGEAALAADAGKSLLEDRARLEKLERLSAELISEIVEHGDLNHKEGCPEDDTCHCEYPNRINSIASLIPNSVLRAANDLARGKQG